MISMRYHIVSLAAVFLALALGIVLGATKINSPILAGLQGDTDTLTVERDTLKQQNADLLGQAASAEQMAEAVSDVAVRGIFKPKPTVVLITTNDANSADRDAILSLLNKADAVVAAQVQLTADFSDPARAAEVRALVTDNVPAGQTLPEVDDVGNLMGGLLSSLLIADDTGSSPASESDASKAISALTTAGFIRTSGELKAGRLVILLTGGAQTGNSVADRAGAIASLAAQLKTTANGVVLAGRQGSATAESGPVGVIRADTADSASVTTVDDVDLASGRLATVLGLAEQDLGKAGRYGIDATAQARVPSLAT